MDQAEFELHMAKGRDPEYFAEHILGIELNPAQRRWFRLVKPRKSNGWEWNYRRVVHVAANQIGKTLGLSILLLWAANYKIGVNSSDWDFWLSSIYKWYHLGPTLGQARLTLRDMQQIMNGDHPAQYDKETLQRRPGYRWLKELAETVKFDEYYEGIKLWNGAEIHFRASDEKGKALQGVRAHGISFDEAAFENYLNEIMDQLVKMRLISTGGPVWLVSTPNGINDYYEIVNSIIMDGRQTFHERVWESPERRWALVWSHISDNIGYGFTQEEVDFMEMDVDPDTKEQQLRGAFLAPKEGYFSPPELITKAWHDNMPDSEEPKPGHRYVAFWDVSVGTDATVLTILDVTRKPWKGVYFKRWATPMGWNELKQTIRETHFKWNSATDYWGTSSSCLTGWDSTSLGGLIVTQELSDIVPKSPLNFAANAKKRALYDAKAHTTGGDIMIPSSWQRLQREMLNYRLKDDKIEQDSVMSYIGAVHLAARGFSGVFRQKFDPGSKRNFNY